MEFDRNKFRDKIEHLIRYEKATGKIKFKTEFAKNYGLPRLQNLYKYYRIGSINLDFIGKICEQYNLTSDFILFDSPTLAKDKLPEIPT